MKKSLFLAILVACTLQCLTQTGTPDVNFGINGKLVANPGFPNFDIKSGVIQNDGKIIIAGSASNGPGNTPTGDYFLTRFLANGTIDNSFGNNGIVYTDMETLRHDWLVKVALLPDGKILAAGMSSAPNSYTVTISFARYTADGKPDSSFNGTGTYYNSAATNTVVTDMQVLPTGKIIITGSGLQLVCFNTDGTVDNSFIQQHFPATELYTALSSAVLPTGKILVAGYVAPFGNGLLLAEIFQARYNANGSIDSSFGTNGQVRAAIDDDFIGEVKLQLSADSTQVYISSFHSTHAYDTNRIALMRYDVNGNADNGFGVKWLSGTSANFIHRIGMQVVVQPDGKLIFTGTTPNNTGINQFSALRLLPNGDYDNSFGTNGILPGLSTGTRHEGVLSLLQPDGKIIIAGYEMHNGNNRLSLARYNADGSGGNSFPATVQAGISARHGELGSDIRIQPDGKILAAGIAANGAYTSVVVLKYKPDGKADSSFGIHGATYSDLTQQPGLAFDFSRHWTDRILSMANDADGNIYVLHNGFHYFQRRNMLTLFKLKPSGVPDSSFAHYGRKDISISETQHDYPVGLAITSDGKPLIAGATTSDNADSSYISLLRFKKDGSLDSSFGINGIARETQFTGNEDISRNQPRRLVIQPDGKILLCGEAKLPFLVRFAVARYNENGSVDPQFNNGAMVVTPVVPNSVNYATAIALQTDGKILVGGITSAAGMCVVRYTNAGALDFSFGVNGVATNLSLGANYTSGMAVQPDGKILILGDLFDDDLAGDMSYIKLSRLRTDGGKDESFGASGDVNIGADPVMQDIAGSVAVGSNGRILVIGGTTAGWDDFYDGKLDLVIYGLTNSLADCNLDKANAGRDTIICTAGTATIGTPSVTGSTYTWTPASNISSTNTAQPVVSPTNNTQYYLTRVNAAGCVTKDTVQVSVQALPATPTITQSGNTLTSSAAMGYQWYKDGLAITGATSQTYMATMPGLYAVTTSQNSCFSNFSNAISVVATGINSPELDKKIMVAPNPVDEDLHIRYTGNFARFDIAILDVSGKRIYANGRFTYSFTLNMRNFTSGAYVVKIVNASTGEKIHRLIMKK